MVDVDSLTDAELRTKLIEYGFPVMPITGTTRKVMAKKLKMLMENKNKINAEGRRSLARYSSEEESDGDAKAAVKKEKRRATMAAPSTKLPVRNRTSRKVEDAPPVVEEKRVTTRTQKITKVTENDYDTGSDSEPEIADYKPSTSYVSSSSHVETSRRYSPPKSIESSINRNLSSYSPSRYTSFSSATSDQASDRLNQIRARLSLGNSGYDRPLYTSSPAVSDQNEEKIETPFLSNFTRRLSQMTADNSHHKLDYDLKNDVIKEHDTNGSGSYSTRTYLSRPIRRDFVKDYQTRKENNIKNNFVSFAVIALALLFFLVLSLLYMGMHNGQTSLTTGLVIPYCDVKNPNSRKGVNCIVDTDLQGAVGLHHLLKPELHRRAVTYHCSDSRIKPFMTEDDVVVFVLTSDPLQYETEIRENLNNMELLTFTNPDWDVSVFAADTSGEAVFETMEQVIKARSSNKICLGVLNPGLPWRCSLYNKIATIVQTVVLLTGIFLTFYSFNVGYKYFKHYRQKQKDELFYMIERIIDTLQTNSADDGGENFLVINHVRDMILPINDRKRMESTWKKAVKFINENESRVRTELQVVQGEPYEVWRWLGNANVSLTGSPKNKSWQGQAFETQVGSVNSLPCSPTPCLKIRGMVDDGDRNLLTIREAVLSKCAHQCRILHCGVDTNSKCVYLKCVDQNDAAVAYRNLHGWWYAGNLVTVKYLRLERYMQRYPDSPVSGPPYLRALQPATDWSN